MPATWTTTTHAVIPNGTDQSGVIDLRGQKLAAVQFPAAWTAADITFLAAEKLLPEGGLFADVWVSDALGAGAELSIDAAANRHVTLDFTGVPSNCFLVIRSGTAMTPVNQGADRDLILYTQPY